MRMYMGTGALIMTRKFFKVDAKAVLTLGRNSIKDATTAVVELIKNSYDADASIVELEILRDAEDFGKIRIADNGHGMSDQDIEASWLRIGFSEKVKNKTSSEYERRKTGEKGIGRLSADRLGAVLQLRTKKRGKSPTGLNIDWQEFEVPGREIGEIELAELSNPMPLIPSISNSASTNSGTELIISELRQLWVKDDIRKLHTELSLLLPPYPKLAKTFAIRFHNDVDDQYNGAIRYGGQAKGEIEFSATLRSNGTLSYRMYHFDPIDRTKRLSTSRDIPWSELVAASDNRKRPLSCKLGSLEIRLSFFVMRPDLLEGSGLNLTQLRHYLKRNMGVRIYRDMVRVKPYGDPEGTEADWLGLGQRKVKDPAGARRSTFKIAPNQLVGAVFAGRDRSPELIDSSSREGLIENDAFRQLKVVLFRCINLIEAKYHQINREQPRPKNKAASAKASVKSLSGNLTNLTSDLTDLQTRVSDDLGDDFAAVAQQIGIVIEQAQAAQRDIDELADQNTVYRGLATVGIASAIFGHETATAINQAGTKVRNVQKMLLRKPPDIPTAIERLEESTIYMDRISSWGKFALTRVNKDKRQRRKTSVTNVVDSILTELEGPMGSADVVLKRSIEDFVEAKTFPMDLEAILINLLTNAYHEVKRHSGERLIRVRLVTKKNNTKDGFELSVADNGEGISPEYEEAIWEPLFSTKADERGRATGTGLGLAIVKSAVEDLGGRISVRAKGPLGGALFALWFPRGLP